MNSNKKYAYASAIAVSILWGLSFIGSKKAVAAGITTFSLVMVRFVVATIVLLLLSLFRKEKLRIEKKDLFAVFLSAISGVTIYYFCELNGLQWTSASVAALIVATIPVFSLLAGIILHHKRPSRFMWIGLAASLLGVYLVVFSNVGENSVKGFLFMFAACLCWVAYLEITDHLLKKYTSICITFWQSLIALITVIPLSMTETVDWASIPLDAWLWSAAFLGLVCSGLCYILNNYSIGILSPQMNALFLNLNPVAAALGGYLILGEEITSNQIIGGIIILTSLFFVSYTDQKQK